MKLSNSSNVPVYTVSGSSTARVLPEWLSQRRKRSTKLDPEYNSRVELLQDFEFEEASQCIRVSEDGEWVMSTGKANLPHRRRTRNNRCSRHLQAPNTHSLPPEPFSIMGTTHRHLEQNLPHPFPRLLQDGAPPRRSVDRISHASGLSLLFKDTEIWKRSCI